jgi:hypothetical protein
VSDFHDDAAETAADNPETVNDTADGATQPYSHLDNESAKVMRAVPTDGTTTPEELAKNTGLPLTTVLHRLSLLDLAAMVERRGDGVALAKRDGRAEPSLADLVSVYLAATPGQPSKPFEIADGINSALTGRRIGTSAVLNSCLRLTATGRLVQTDHAPVAFAFPASSTPATDEHDSVH